jgi:hypothetical protein
MGGKQTLREVEGGPINRFLHARVDEWRMGLQPRNIVRLLVKAGLVARVANEVRGLIFAGAVRLTRTILRLAKLDLCCARSDGGHGTFD